VLPGPRVSTAPHCLTLPHPTAAHRAPTSSRPTCQLLCPRSARPPPPLFAALSPAAPARRVSHAATRAAQSRRARVVPAPRDVAPRPPISAPSPAPRGTEPDPLPFSSPPAPPSRHKKVSPDVVPRFACFPLARASSPTSFPSTPLSTDGDQEAPDRAGFRLNCAVARLHR
jgi:hypothetical protein